MVPTILMEGDDNTNELNPPRGGIHKIIHVDMDCFFAAVEMRNQPLLRHRPLAVGGSPDHRGVIATANYQARKFGVRSAMSSKRALQLCPQLVICKPNFEAYKQESKRIRAIFSQYTNLIEPLSLDEAFLDVTNSSACNGLATAMAKEIKARIYQETELTASAGVAMNKFVAKVASDWNKPNGLKVVLPQETFAFVSALPIERIYGVGPVTAEKIHKLGVKTCRDLQEFSAIELRHHFGKWGLELYHLCRGIDERPVEPRRVRKSLSVEQTYAQDLPDLMACIRSIPELYSDFERRLGRAGVADRIKGWLVKVKWSDFQQTTMERSHAAIPQQEDFVHLLSEILMNYPDRQVRLLGLGVKLKSEVQSRYELQQLKFTL